MPTTVAAVMGASLLGGSGLWISNPEHHSAILSKISNVSDAIKKGEAKISSFIHGVDKNGDGKISADEMVDSMHDSDQDLHHNLLLGAILGAAAILVTVIVYLLLKKLSSKAKLGKGDLTLTFDKLSGIPKGKLVETQKLEVIMDYNMQQLAKKPKPEDMTLLGVLKKETLQVDLAKKTPHHFSLDFGSAESTELTIEADVKQQPDVKKNVVGDSKKGVAKVDLSKYTNTPKVSIKLKLESPDSGFFGRLFAKSMVLEGEAKWTPKK